MQLSSTSAEACSGAEVSVPLNSTLDELPVQYRIEFVDNPNVTGETDVVLAADAGAEIIYRNTFVNTTSTAQIVTATITPFVTIEGGVDCEGTPEDFDFEVVGFDAIAFLVAFSDTNRPGSFPQRLNGEISLNSIRKIFTGKQEQISTAWQYEPLVRAFDTADSNLQGTNDQAREIQSVIADFKQLAFLSEQEYRQFESLLLRSNNQVSNIYEYLLAEFESQDPADPTITISFDRFSNMFAQCSVYPLAIRQGNTLSSLIIEANGDLITPETDLCDKGRYWANSAAFPITTQSGKQRLDREQAYPLATELAVIYPKCNVEKTEADRPCNAGQAFAQMLQTLEGQYLLQELELIPMVPIEQIRQNL